MSAPLVSTILLASSQYVSQPHFLYEEGSAFHIVSIWTDCVNSVSEFNFQRERESDTEASSESALGRILYLAQKADTLWSVVK